MIPHTLRGITWKHERGYDPLVATAAEYARAHPDVRIEWTSRSLQAFADQPIAELAASYDLIVMDHPHVGEVAENRCLIPLEELVPAQELAILKAESVGRSHDSYNWQGHQWALAIDAAAQVSAYRPDLLPAVPQRWADVVELAARGLVLWPLKPVDAASSFFTLCANRGTPVASSGENVLIRAEDAVPVLEAMAEVACAVPPFCLTMNPIEVLDLLARGEDYAYAPLLYGYTNYSRAGFRAFPIEFADIPAFGHNGPVGSMLGGAGLAVSSRCASPTVAADYALNVARAETQRGTYVNANGQPANAVAWEDPGANELCRSFFTRTRDTLDGSWIRPRYAGYVDVQSRVGELVTAYLSESLAAAEVVQMGNEVYRASLSNRSVNR